MTRPKGKKYDGVTRPPNEAYKNGWIVTGKQIPFTF